MKTDKNDRRVKYTKMVLEESLIKLLQRRPIDKLSVTAICEAADINRSTFYSHYTDQYDLLQQVQEKVLQEINEHLADYRFTGSEAELFQMMNRILEYIAANAMLCEVLLGQSGENGANALQQAILKIVQRQVIKELQSTRRLDADMMEYVLLFAVNGSIGMVEKWLQTGMKKSAREMAEVVLMLTYRGMSAYL